MLQIQPPKHLHNAFVKLYNLINRKLKSLGTLPTHRTNPENIIHILFLSDFFGIAF